MHTNDDYDDSDTWYCYPSKQHGETTRSKPTSETLAKAKRSPSGPLGFGVSGLDEDNPDGLTKITRERANGRLVQPDPPAATSTVDRNTKGKFASRDREPVPFLRDDGGDLSLDPFAVGNFDTSTDNDNGGGFLR